MKKNILSIFLIICVLICASLACDLEGGGSSTATPTEVIPTVRPANDTTSATIDPTIASLGEGVTPIATYPVPEGE